MRIAITAAAYHAVCATLPLGSVSYEADANERGLIWLEASMADRLRAMRRPGRELFGRPSPARRDGGRVPSPGGPLAGPRPARDWNAFWRAVSAHLLFPASATVLCSARRG